MQFWFPRESAVTLREQLVPAFRSTVRQPGCEVLCVVTDCESVDLSAWCNVSDGFECQAIAAPSKLKEKCLCTD